MKAKPSADDTQTERKTRTRRASKPSMHAPTVDGGESAAGSAERTSKAADSLGTDASERRRRMIETAAYFRAEKRGFGAGRELEDWLEAEQEVAQLPPN
jgi:hypothetical protein